MNNKNFSLNVTKNELIAINNALNEVLNGPEAIDEEEFETRIGETKSTIQKILAQIASLLKTQ